MGHRAISSFGKLNLDVNLSDSKRDEENLISDNIDEKQAWGELVNVGAESK